jgi:hypothetical protein
MLFEERVFNKKKGIKGLLYRQQDQKKELLTLFLSWICCLRPLSSLALLS